VLGGGAAAKMPTYKGKAAATAATVATVAATAGTIEILKDKFLDSFEDLVNNRPPCPGQGGFNLIDVNS
jgi:hypothetical protein